MICFAKNNHQPPTMTGVKVRESPERERERDRGSEPAACDVGAEVEFGVYGDTVVSCANQQSTSGQKELYLEGAGIYFGTRNTFNRIADQK